MPSRVASTGQVLVLFVLFLLVLLGVSAVGIDYATWLLTDRNLQNVSDHAALAGASEFDQRISQGSCSGGPGAAKCFGARAQAWRSLVDELKITDNGGNPILDPAINALAAGDTLAGGQADGAYGGQNIDFRETIWVTTPPPAYAAYSSVGGHFALNYGVVFVRVDRDATSFIGGALGIKPQPRHGWSTAGALPTDFALETFCRNHIAPQSGVCENSAGITVDGQGGIRLLRGDIGSNESLTVTANNGGGVVVESGNVFIVNRDCAPSTWRCPNGPPSLGGISDGTNGKNAFYMAPLSVPQFESPINANTVSAYNCATADATHLCVPHKDQTGSTPSGPGDWTCSATSNTPVRCGLPTITSGTVTCTGQGGGSPQLHYYPITVSSGAANVEGDAGHIQSNGNEYRNIDDDIDAGDPDTGTPPASSPTDWVYAPDINITGSGGPQSTSFIVNLGASGPRLSGDSTVRYVAFKTFGGVTSGTGNEVTLQVNLLPASGTTPIIADPTVRTLTDTPTRYAFTVNSGVIASSEYNSLRLQFVFTSSGSTAAADERGGGVSWAEIEHPGPQPSQPPFIPPGYYRSIDIPANSCAILDPTAEYSSLLDDQMPGIYRFGGSGSPNDRRIKIGDGSFLVGDGVTLVFDANWPDSGASQGVAIGANGALVLNTMRVTGATPPCTPSETETSSVNMSAPYLSDLPYSALCAAWSIDNSVTTGVRPGQNAWDRCDLSSPDSGAHCTERNQYDPPAGYRGVTFYFTPDPGWSTAHGSMDIRNRFEMQGGSGNEAGIAFRGVMYAPYDDVKITGGNGFNTVGQVLAWTAKFNGGSAYIDLDYPYDYTPASPYLLEPTVDH